jgi:hypothetical protein
VVDRNRIARDLGIDVTDVLAVVDHREALAFRVERGSRQGKRRAGEPAQGCGSFHRHPFRLLCVW